jgi:hypothetical protein
MKKASRALLREDKKIHNCHCFAENPHDHADTDFPKEESPPQH